MKVPQIGMTTGQLSIQIHKQNLQARKSKTQLAGQHIGLENRFSPVGNVAGSYYVCIREIARDTDCYQFN